MNIQSRTPVDDILSDDNDRRILDSTDKIIRWINYQYEEQEIKHEENTDIPYRRYIDLSNCIICTRTTDGKPALTNLCDLAGKIECVVNTYNDYPHKTRFHQEVLEEIICHNSVIHGAFFHCTKFHQQVYILNTVINNGDFSRCEFLEYTFIQDCQLSFGSFEGSIFHKAVSFSKSEFDHFQIIFRNCIFKDDTSFHSIKIKGEGVSKELLPHCYIDFSHSTFLKNFSLLNVELPTHCWFDDCIFEQTVILRDITSQHIISFANALVKKQILIFVSEKDRKNQIEDLIISHLNISGRVDIEDSQINVLRANFTNLQDKGILRIFRSTILNCDMDSLCNRGILDFEDNKISNITLASAINLGVIELENTEINTSNISNRKTARLLKDSAYKSNNNIDGLKYRALELDIYQSKEAQLPWYSNDKVILFLNKISNNYDRNFWWGVGWTFASAIIAFWGINYFGTTHQIFELNYKFDFTEFGEIWKKYLDVLNVLNFRERLNGVELNAVGETIFLVSKVFIAYFMYQTIAAFRKYRKNP